MLLRSRCLGRLLVKEQLSLRASSRVISTLPLTTRNAILRTSTTFGICFGGFSVLLPAKTLSTGVPPNVVRPWEIKMQEAATLAEEGSSDKLEKALVLCRSALSDRKATKNSQIADSVDFSHHTEYIATRLHSRGSLLEARVLYEVALEGYDTTCSPDHPFTLAAVSNLAMLLWDMKDFDAAEVMCRRAVKGDEMILGSGHPDTVDSVRSLVNVLSANPKDKSKEIEQLRSQYPKAFT